MAEAIIAGSAEETWFEAMITAPLGMRSKLTNSQRTMRMKASRAKYPATRNQTREALGMPVMPICASAWYSPKNSRVSCRVIQR